MQVHFPRDSYAFVGTQIGRRLGGQTDRCSVAQGRAVQNSVSQSSNVIHSGGEQASQRR